MVHVMRENVAWLPELSRIALVDGEIAGVIMYFEAKIKKNDGSEVKIASFGPLCVSHKYRAMGIGKKLMTETLPLAKAAGYPGVLIIGEPDYYPKAGFIIENGNDDIGMCVISTEKEKTEVTYIWLKEEFCNKGIEEDIKTTLEKQN